MLVAHTYFAIIVIRMRALLAERRAATLMLRLK